MGWLIGPLVAVLLTAVIGTGALLSVVINRKPTGGALERVNNNTATPQDMEALQGAGQDFVRSAQILRAGGSLIGSRGPIPNIGGGAAGRIVGGAGVLGGAGVRAAPTGAESALGGVVNRAIGGVATRASQPPLTRDNPSTVPAGGGRVGSPSSTGQGTGGAGSDIPGATEAGTQFRGQAPGGQPSGPTSGAAGGGKEPIPKPGQETGPASTGAVGTATGQQPPQQGLWCYSEKTQEMYWWTYGSCPPPHMKPPAGAGVGPPKDPSVRVPWQGQVPSEKPPMGGKSPMGGGPCLPPCHIKPGTKDLCHCPGE
jgi:hypothetical protein